MNTRIDRKKYLKPVIDSIITSILFIYTHIPHYIMNNITSTHTITYLPKEYIYKKMYGHLFELSVLRSEVQHLGYFLIDSGVVPIEKKVQPEDLYHEYLALNLPQIIMVLNEVHGYPLIKPLRIRIPKDDDLYS